MKIKIENYENMTPEEKLAALENYDPEKDGFVSKATFDKTATEAATFKKQLREKQTEEEQKAEKDKEERERLIARVQELEHKETVSNYTNAYLGLGYDEKTAKATAEALAKGDMATVFANQKSHIASREQALRSELVDQTPPPVGVDGGDGGTTLEQLKAMTPQARFEFSQKNPEEYKKLYGGN